MMNNISQDTVNKYQSPVEPERLYGVANYHWRIMLGVTIVIFIAGIAAGAYMLVMTFMNMSVNRAETGQVQNINRKELVRVVRAFSERENRFIGLQSATSTFADPSR